MQLSIFCIPGFEEYDEPAPAQTPQVREPRLHPMDDLPDHLCPCLLCGEFVLLRPGRCLRCTRRAGAALVPFKVALEKSGLDPEREERIRRYAERAAMKQPLFCESAPAQILEVA